MRILLQYPEGLRKKAFELAEKLEKEGNEVFLCIEPCYGACDIREREAKLLGCEKIIHLAHTRFMKTEIPVEYVEMRENPENFEINFKELEKIEFEKIGIVATLQFLDFIPLFEKELEKLGKKVFVGKGRDNGKFLYPGQVLGCDFSQALEIESEVECFLLISSGKFHGVGLATKTSKPVYVFDAEKNKVIEIDRKEFEKTRILARTLAEQAKVVGIYVSVKPGQFNPEIARKIKNLAENKGKKAFLLLSDELKPEKVEYLGIECIINTACPRLVDEQALYKIPIVNWDEFLKILKK